VPSEEGGYHQIIRLCFLIKISTDTLICDDTKIVFDVEKPSSLYGWLLASLELAGDVTEPDLYSVLQSITTR
jgi:hypothetical protein